MNKGFFSLSKIQTRQKTGQIAHCGLCGLHKHCKSPKMPPTGEGRKKILIVAEAPGEREDKYRGRDKDGNEIKGTQLIGKVGQYFRREHLKPLGIDLDLDCWKTNAIICRPLENKTPEDYMIKACRPNLMKTIQKYQPNVILLLGAVACKSLLSEIWKDDKGTAISRWAGFCIPCTNPNAWVIPTFHPSYLSRTNDEVLDRIFKQHLKLAISKAKSKPWKEIPDYKKQIEIIVRPSQAAKIIREMIRKGGPSAFDYEANCLKPEGEGTELVSCSICWRGRRTISYPWQGEAIEATSDFIKSSIPKIASNLNFEDRWTRVKLGHRVRNWWWDTMIAAHILDNRPGITSIKFQSFIHLGMPSYNMYVKPFLKSTKGSRFNRIRELDLKDLLLYNGLDSYLEYKVAMKQIRLLEKRN